LSPGGNDIEDNPFEAEFVEEALSEPADDDEPSEPSSVNNFAVLDSSLPSATTQTEANHLTSYASAKRSANSRTEKKHRTRWHFGIRSRSPPMEIMLELYKTLKVLGMQWKEKKNLGGLGGIQRKFSHKTGQMEFTNIRRNRQLDGEGDPPISVDKSAASHIYFIETRARVGNVVVLMNLQLYMMDEVNYLVDFHHKGSYYASQIEGADKYDPATPEEKALLIPEHPRMDGDKDGDETVVSPYLFMDVACKLILELAGGGE
jgi:carbon catabolite-derepressing protein kinase